MGVGVLVCAALLAPPFHGLWITQPIRLPGLKTWAQPKQSTLPKQWTVPDTFPVAKKELQQPTVLPLERTIRAFMRRLQLIGWLSRAIVYLIMKQGGTLLALPSSAKPSSAKPQA